jgi:hypothetical protein
MFSDIVTSVSSLFSIHSSSFSFEISSSRISFSKLFSGIFSSICTNCVFFSSEFSSITFQLHVDNISALNHEKSEKLIKIKKDSIQIQMLNLSLDFRFSILFSIFLKKFIIFFIKFVN